MKLWEENSIKSYYRVLPSFVWSRVLVVVFVSLTDVLLFVSLFFFAGFSFTGWYFVDVHQRPLMACDWTTSRRVVLRRRRRRSRPPRIRPAVLVSFSMFCFVFFGPTPPSRTPETHTHTHTHTHAKRKRTADFGCYSLARVVANPAPGSTLRFGTEPKKTTTTTTNQQGLRNGRSVISACQCWPFEKENKKAKQTKKNRPQKRHVVRLSAARWRAPRLGPLGAFLYGRH